MARSNSTKKPAATRTAPDKKPAATGIAGLWEKRKWIDPFTYVDLFVMPRLNPEKNPWKENILYVFFALVFAFALYSLVGFLLGSPTPLVIVVSGSMEPVLYRGDVAILGRANVSAMNVPAVETGRATLSNTLLSELARPVPDVRSNPGSTLESLFFFDSNQSVFIRKTGPIVVYTSSCGHPIVHRVVAKLHAADGWYVLTKGDSVHNPTVDADCPRVPIDALARSCNSREQPCITFFPVHEKTLSGASIVSIPAVGCLKLWVLDDVPSLLFSGRLPSTFTGVC